MDNFIKMIAELFVIVGDLPKTNEPKSVSKSEFRVLLIGVVAVTVTVAFLI